VDRDSSVGTGWRSFERIPVGARYSAPVQTGPRAQSASCTGSFPEVKLLGSGVNHPSHPKPRLKKELSYSSVPSRKVLG